MVRMDSFSSVPPHIQPPMAQVPSAIRELTRFVPSILMYSSMVVLSRCLLRDRVPPFKWLRTATIEPALGETHRVQLFLLMQRANVRHQGVNLILSERIFEGRHSSLAVGHYLSEFRIGHLLDHMCT